MKSIKTLSFAFLGIILSLFFAACGDSNSTSTDQHEHFEAEGWNLYWVCQSGSNETSNKSVNMAGSLDFIGFACLI